MSTNYKEIFIILDEKTVGEYKNTLIRSDTIKFSYVALMDVENICFRISNCHFGSFYRDKGKKHIFFIWKW